MSTNTSHAAPEPEHPFQKEDVTASAIFDAMKKQYGHDGFDKACERGDMDIYVLESPHLHEMMYERMLAGDSGVVFSQCLSENGSTKVPFGLFGVAPWPSKPKSLQGIGAINACSFPMQADTYGPARLSLPGLNKAVNALGRLRDRPEASRRKGWDREFEALILRALAERVRSLVAEGVMFYPCGKVARGLLNKARALIEDVDVDIFDRDIPHPSRNTWRGLDLSQIRRKRRSKQPVGNQAGRR